MIFLTPRFASGAARSAHPWVVVQAAAPPAGERASRVAAAGPDGLAVGRGRFTVQATGRAIRGRGSAMATTSDSAGLAIRAGSGSAPPESSDSSARRRRAALIPRPGALSTLASPADPLTASAARSASACDANASPELATKSKSAAHNRQRHLPLSSS